MDLMKRLTFMSVSGTLHLRNSSMGFSTCLIVVYTSRTQTHR
jgi:hypothetical protein